jgi:hypothetical protein
MGSSKGGGGDPSAFTGGMPSAPPPGAMTPSSPNVVPSYASFLPSGAGMATPESVAAAALAAPRPMAAPAGGAMYAPGGPPSPQINEDALRQMMAQLMTRFQPRDTNPGSSFSPFGASSNSGGGYQSRGNQSGGAFGMPSASGFGGMGGRTR